MRWIKNVLKCFFPSNLYVFIKWEGKNIYKDIHVQILSLIALQLVGVTIFSRMKCLRNGVEFEHFAEVKSFVFSRSEPHQTCDSLFPVPVSSAVKMYSIMFYVFMTYYTSVSGALLHFVVFVSEKWYIDIFSLLIWLLLCFVCTWGYGTYLYQCETEPVTMFLLNSKSFPLAGSSMLLFCLVANEFCVPLRCFVNTVVEHN